MLTIVASSFVDVSTSLTLRLSLLKVQETANRHKNQKKRYLEHNKFAVAEGDWISMINGIVIINLVFESYVQVRKSVAWCQTNQLNSVALGRIYRIRNELQKVLKKQNIPLISCGSNLQTLQKCIASGLFSHAAKLLPDGSYRAIGGKEVFKY
jgi:hypothetical protein